MTASKYLCQAKLCPVTSCYERVSASARQFAKRAAFEARGREKALMQAVRALTAKSFASRGTFLFYHHLSRVF